MYKCKYCGEEFEKAHQVGGHVYSKHRQTKDFGTLRIEENAKKYNLNPKHCLYCDNIIPYSQVRGHKHIKYCSQECNGLDKIKNPQKTKSKNLKEKQNKLCLNCGLILDINTKTFCNSECSVEYKAKKYIKEWLETKTLPIKDGNVSSTVRKYILEEQNNKCDICGIDNVWNNKPLMFIVDHIDGNSNNNSRENLRMVCSNCDSQLDTYKSKNKGSGRYYRKQRYLEGKSS